MKNKIKKFIQHLFYKKLFPAKPEKLYQYWDGWWKNPTTIERYKKGISPNLQSVIREYVKKENEILDIGCGLGIILDFFHSLGCENLTGVELNQKGINLFSQWYPQTFKKTTMHNKPIENIVNTFPENKFDITFSRGTLIYISPRFEWVFKEIARITKKYLIINEKNKNAFNIEWKEYPIDFEAIFEKYGFRNIETIRPSNPTKKTIWVFEKIDKK